ncbi:MAG TPA: phosphotransferase [Mycobacteriales bacterium]|nr:phosphotransferase [Mycobacteriales bacterium]
MGEEIPLAGGNVSDAVVRVGETVRKPVGPQTPAVEALLEHLIAAGIENVPRPLGRDEQGRQVLEYIPGTLAHQEPPLDPAGLHRIGRIARELHDAAADFLPPPDAAWDVLIPPDRAELIVHNDLAPWNLIRNGERWVVIDWDAAGPGSRLWDLDYAATGFLPFTPDGDPGTDGPRLRALIDGYGLGEPERHDLAAMLGDHAHGMYELLVDGARTGTQPWARLHAEGHADYWGPAAAYIRQHRDGWLRSLLS